MRGNADVEKTTSTGTSKYSAMGRACGAQQIRGLPGDEQADTKDKDPTVVPMA